MRALSRAWLYTRVAAALAFLAVAMACAGWPVDAQTIGPNQTPGPAVYASIGGGGLIPPAPNPGQFLLKYPRPTLISPITVNVPDGDQSYTESVSQDYIINASAHHSGQLTWTGGHNVVMIGAQTTTAPGTNTNVGTHACFYFKDGTGQINGTISIEGSWCHGTGAYTSAASGETDGFDFATPARVVQIQNTRCDGPLFGWTDELHSDCFEPYGGTQQFLVYNVTGHMAYQGESVFSATGANNYIDTANANFDVNGNPQTFNPHSNGGVMLWVDNAGNCSPVTYENYQNTYLGSNRTYYTDISGLFHGTGCTTLVGSPTGTVTFSNPVFHGGLTWGFPPGGDYAPTWMIQSYPSNGYSAISLSPLLNNQTISLDGATYTAQNADRTWSAQPYADGSILFTVKTGDVWVFDSGKNRSEVAGSTTYAPGTPVDLTYNMTIPSGADIAATWNTVGQFHQVENDGHSPPFEFTFLGNNKMGIEIGYLVGGVEQFNHIWTDSSDIIRDHQYAIEVKATFDQSTGAGSLQVLRDGVALVFNTCSCTTYTGSMGFPGMSGVYFKEGWYRLANTTETESVKFSVPIFH